MTRQVRLADDVAAAVDAQAAAEGRSATQVANTLLRAALGQPAQPGSEPRPVMPATEARAEAVAPAGPAHAEAPPARRRMRGSPGFRRFA